MLLPSNDSEECTDGLVLIVQLVTSCIRYTCVCMTTCKT